MNRLLQLGLLAEVLEEHVRRHTMTPEKSGESPEELANLINVVHAYLK
jgi:DNA-binding FrmR family transcriptional regulator